MKRVYLHVLTAGVLMGAVMFLMSASARAAFPGVNGLIAFTSDRDGNYEVYSIAPNGAETNLTNDPASQDASPAWSPDGRTIVFERDFELYTMDADGGHITQVPGVPAVGPADPTWSPNGNQIAFDGYTPDGGSDIYIINLDGTGLRNLTVTLPAPSVPSNEYNPEWSPDGHEILFTSDRENPVTGETPGTYVYDLRDDSQTKLIDDFGASWSPDGTKIVFSRPRNGGPYSDIYVASLSDLAHPTKLTDDPSVNYNPRWSPDGTKIVFSSNRSDLAGNYQLYVVPSDHLDIPQRLTNDAGADFAPDWQPVPLVDTTPPTIDVPADIQAEATSPAGAAVTYDATASDPDDPVASFDCAPASGSTFRLGTTTVACTARDAHGNSAGASFRITVSDTTAPTFNDVPSDITVAAGPGGDAVVDYTPPTATDVVDGPVAVSCSPPPGATFHLGVTTVTCSASDSLGNTASASFHVAVEAADLALSLTAPTGPLVAGDPAGADLTVHVTNLGPQDNAGGYTVFGSLAPGTAFESGAGCTSLPGGFACSATGLAAGASDTYVVNVRAAPSAGGNTVDVYTSVVSNGTLDPNGANNLDIAEFEITTSADLAVSMSGPAAAQRAGDPAGFDYTITVRNDGPSDSDTSFELHGRLPAGISFIGGDCSDDLDGFICFGGSIAAGRTDTFVAHVVTAMDAPAGIAVASVTLFANGSSDPNPGNDSDSTAVTIIRLADLEIGIDAPQLVIPGSSADIHVSVLNHGPNPNDGGYTVTGSLPSGITFGGGTGCAAGGSGFVCTGGSVAIQSTDIFTVHVEVAASLWPPTQLLISASVGSNGTPDNVSTDDSAQTSVLIDPEADLGVSLSAPQVGQVPGDPAGFDLTLQVTNAGPSDFTGTYTASISPPPGIVFITLGTVCSQMPLQVVACDGGDLAAGTTATFTIHALTDPNLSPGSTTVTASLSSTRTHDPNPNNQTASATVPIAQATADLAVTIDQVGPDSVAVGQDLVLTVSVRNLGLWDQIGGFVVTGDLPSDLGPLLRDPVQTDPACSPSPTGFRCSGGALTVGAARTFRLTAPVLTLPDPPASATVSVSSLGTPDPQTGNNAASTVLDIITIADLSVTLDAPTTARIAGDPAGFDYSIGVTNGGPSPNVGGYTVHGQLPAGVTFVGGNGCSAAGGGFDCSSSAGLAVHASDHFTVHVAVAPTLTGTGLQARVTVSSSGTNDPNPNDDAAVAGVTVIARADEHATGLTSTPAAPVVLAATSDPTRNSVTFRFSLTNDGPSEARSVSVDTTGIQIDGYCLAQLPTDCSTAGQFSPTPPVLGALDPGRGATIVMTAHADPLLRHGPLTWTGSFTVTSTTPDPNPGNESLSMSVSVITVPDPVTNLRATPGNGNLVVSWAPPAATGGAPLDTAAPYVLTMTSTGPTVTVQVTPSAAGPCLVPEGSICYDVTGLTNGRRYQANVVAVNTAGNSDPAIPVVSQADAATPSANSAAKIIAPNRGWGLPATCSVATAARPICVTQYAGNGGGGGIVAIQAGVPLASNFCGGASCPGGAGVLAFASSRSWVDPARPIVVTITWDASLGPHQPAIYAQHGNGTPTILAQCNGSKANPDPCLRSYQTVMGSPSNPGRGDRTASILFTSDVGSLVVAQP
jgi:Tol biopolymer transport system component